MKNTRDPFDDELRNRLDNYSEEPDDTLWSGIASNIETVRPPFAWSKWLSISSVIVVMTATVLYFSSSHTTDKELAQAASASLAKGAADAKKPEDTSSQQERTSANEQLATGEQPATTTDIVPGDQGIEVNKRSIISQPRRQSAPTKSAQLDRVHVTLHATATIDSSGKTSVATITPTADKIESRESGSNTLQSDGTPDANRLETSLVSPTTASADPNEQRRNSERTTSPLASQNSETAVAKEIVAALRLANQTVVTIQVQEQRQSNVQATSVDKKQDVGNISQTISKNVIKDSVNSRAGDRSVTKAVASKEDGGNGKQRSDRKLSLYFTAMPTLGYQRIEANQNDNVFIESISKVSNFSAKRLGIRAEIGAEYALTRKFRIFGGVLYYQRKQTIDYIERVPVNDVVENPVDTVVVIQPEFTSQARTFEYELRNLGVQLGVNYVLKEKKFLHTIGTGIEFHKALNKLAAEKQELGFHSNPSTFVFANVYYRVQYPAQGRLRGVFQPTFNYSLYLDQNMNAPFFVKPYGLGLNVGLTYHF